MFHQAYSNILIKFRQPSIFELDELGKSCTPQKKAQNIWQTLYLYSWLSFDV